MAIVIAILPWASPEAKQSVFPCCAHHTTQVVKGGKIMGFRCVAIVGNSNGLVGVGCMAGREVAMAVKRTLLDAKRNVVSTCVCACV
jgi:ribosomal protein S5